MLLIPIDCHRYNNMEKEIVYFVIMIDYSVVNYYNHIFLTE